jgi:hypothetical protein
MDMGAWLFGIDVWVETYDQERQIFIGKIGFDLRFNGKKKTATTIGCDRWDPMLFSESSKEKQAGASSSGIYSRICSLRSTIQ